MTDKISHSAWKKYLTCPAMYDLHYNKKLRPDYTTSSLVYGSAMDEALNLLLEGKGGVLKKFQEELTKGFMGRIACDAKDIDIDIVGREFYGLKKKLFKRTTLDLEPAEGAIANKLAFKTLLTIGQVSLRGYKDHILPKIKKTVAVQKELDGRRGFIDAIVELENGDVVLVDHKTSRYPYDDDAGVVDSQLALYAADMKLDKVGFIVLLKDLIKEKIKICVKCEHNGSGRSHRTCPNELDGKRCGGEWEEQLDLLPNIQFLMYDLPKRNKKMVVDSITEVEQMIEAKRFPKNLGTCGFMYGKKCPYIDYCWKNKKTNLTKEK